MSASMLKVLYISLVGLAVFLQTDRGSCQESLPTPSVPEYQPQMAAPDPISLPSEALSITQLEQMAERHNPTLEQAILQIQALRGQQVQVGLYPNPVIGYQAEEIGENGQAGQHGMFLRQDIITANKLGLNRAVTSHEVDQAEWNWQMQRQRVINDVRSRAYRVLAAQRTMKIADELVRIGQTAVNVAERFERAREVSQVDVLQARVEANSAKLELVAARKTHAAVWRQLVMVVGVPEMPAVPLADSLAENFPTYSWEEAAAAIRSTSPQLAYAQASVERARCAVARACAGRTPDIQTGAAVRYNDESDDTTLSLQVGVPLMIFNRNQGNIMKANAELLAAQREVQRIELSLQDRLAAVYREYDIAREQVEQYQHDILPYARQSLEMTRTGYEQGEFGYLQLLTAQQTYSRTNLAYIARLRDLWLASVQIDGMLLSGGLDAPGR